MTFTTFTVFYIQNVKYGHVDADLQWSRKPVNTNED